MRSFAIILKAFGGLPFRIHIYTHAKNKMINLLNNRQKHLFCRAGIPRVISNRSRAHSPAVKTFRLHRKDPRFESGWAQHQDIVFREVEYNETSLDCLLLNVLWL